MEYTIWVVVLCRPLSRCAPSPCPKRWREHRNTVSPTLCNLLILNRALCLFSPLRLCAMGQPMHVPYRTQLRAGLEQEKYALKLPKYQGSAQFTRIK